MSRIPLSLAAALGLVAALFIATPAQAATYSVTAALSATKADVGQTVKITGTVGGAGAANKRLAVQRRIGSGAWATIGTAVTGANKKYSYTHKVSKTGAQQFRVYAPASNGVSGKASDAKSFTGWIWLNLTQQPHSAGGSLFWDTEPTVKATKRPHSVEQFDDNTFAFWDLDNKCDQSKVALGTYDTASGTASGSVQTDEGSAGYTVSAGVATFANHVALASDYLQISKTAGAPLVISSPRVHCSIARLPDPSF